MEVAHGGTEWTSVGKSLRRLDWDGFGLEFDFSSGILTLSAEGLAFSLQPNVLLSQGFLIVSVQTRAVKFTQSKVRRSFPDALSPGSGSITTHLLPTFWRLAAFLLG